MTVDEAVSQAKTEIARLFPDLSRDVRLEEAETPLSTGKTWRLTFSMARPPEPEEENGNAFASLLRARRARKVIELEPDMGNLVSIKNA